MRQILANLCDGKPLFYLDNLASGSLGRVVCFLAAARHVKYIFIGQSRDGAAYSFCGPDFESAVDLCQRVLNLPPPHVLPHQCSYDWQSEEGDGMSVVRRDAIERIAMGLRDRHDCVFVLASLVDGEPAAELDYSALMKHENARDWVRWFLSEKLQAGTSSSSFHATQPHGAGYV